MASRYVHSIMTAEQSSINLAVPHLLSSQTSPSSCRGRRAKRDLLSGSSTSTLISSPRALASFTFVAVAFLSVPTRSGLNFFTVFAGADRGYPADPHRPWNSRFWAVRGEIESDRASTAYSYCHQKKRHHVV